MEKLTWSEYCRVSNIINNASNALRILVTEVKGFEKYNSVIDNIREDENKLDEIQFKN